MKLFKRLFTLILSCALVLLITPARVQAQDFSSARIDEALAFIQGKGFMVGTVLSSFAEGNKVTLNVSYLSGETSTLIYEELDNGDVEVTVIESHASNVILYSTSGNVFIDNTFNRILTDRNTAPANNQYLRDYVSLFSETVPAGCDGNHFTGNETTTDYIYIGVQISGLTVNVLAQIMANSVGIPNSSFFGDMAADIITWALDHAVNAIGLSYVRYTQTDNYSGPAPLIVYKKHRTVFTLLTHSSEKCIYEKLMLV